MNVVVHCSMPGFQHTACGLVFDPNVKRTTEEAAVTCEACLTTIDAGVQAARAPTLAAPPAVIEIEAWERLQRVQDRTDRLTAKETANLERMINMVRRGRTMLRHSLDYLRKLEAAVGLRWPS